MKLMWTQREIVIDSVTQRGASPDPQSHESLYNRHIIMHGYGFMGSKAPYKRENVVWKVMFVRVTGSHVFDAVVWMAD